MDKNKYNKHICFIVPNYPTKQDPVYTFVGELINSIAELGIKCTVIAPQSISNLLTKRKRKRAYSWVDETQNGYKIHIHQPIHFPFLNIRIFNKNLSAIITKKSITRTYKRLKLNPNVIYSHFWHYGVIAGSIGKNANLPVFVATGESEIWVKNLFSDKVIKKSLENVNGAICVSRKNLVESVNLGLISEEKTKVIPNSINNKTFYPLEKEEVRKQLGYNQEDFIVAYLGAFTHRKGVERLSKAIENLSEVKSIFIGKGPLKPNCSGVLFAGGLPHDQIVKYLNAADVFVLPTLAEGCSNAIIEAMACGLPIISSDLSFNDDILTDLNSVRIDSNNIKEIEDAIKYLKDNVEVRQSMSQQSLKIAKELNINSRAKKILEYINLNVEYDNEEVLD